MALIEITWKPGHRQLRNFGTICLVAFAAVGTWIFFRHTIFGMEMGAGPARITAGVLWVLAGLCGVLRMLAPVALRPLYLALTVITFPIGYVFSHVLLAVMFYVVLTPIGLIFLAFGRDSLRRKFDRQASTYWVRREPVTDVKRYFRQF